MLFPKALITSPADVSTPQSRHVAFPSCTCTLSCLLVCKPWCAAAACHGTLTLRPAQPGDPSFGQTAEAHLQLHLRLLRACSGRVKSLKLEALRVDLVPTTVQAAPRLEKLHIEDLLPASSQSDSSLWAALPAALPVLRTLILQGCLLFGGSSFHQLAGATGLEELRIVEHATPAKDVGATAALLVEGLPKLTSLTSLSMDIDFAVLDDAGLVCAAVGQMLQLLSLEMTLCPNIFDELKDGADCEDIQYLEPGSVDPAAHWQGLQQLEKLVLGSQPYSMALKEGLAGLCRLQKLTLLLDEETVCPPDVWRCRGLERLKIVGGCLDFGPGCCLPSLTHLQLESCEPPSSDWVGALPVGKLEHLILNNIFLGVDKGAQLASNLVEAGQVTMLLLEHAGLVDMPQALTRLRTLFYLGLRGNQLTTLPPGPYLRGLWCLDLGQQGLLQATPTLSSIPKVLAAATRLEGLILDPPYDPETAVGPLNPSFFNLSHADVVLLASRLPSLETLRLTAREGFRVSAAQRRQSATMASLKAKRPDVRVV